MTSPERLRRRQRIEGTLLLCLGLLTVLLGVYFEGRDQVQRACFQAYIANNAETSAIRAEQVVKESDATRRVIERALEEAVNPDSDPDALEDAREDYTRALDKIDRARANNPVQPFNEERCVG